MTRLLTPLICGILLLGTACIAPHKGPRLVTPDASEAAKALLQDLYALKGKHTLSGQHNYSHDGERMRSSDTILAITGEMPAIWGSDFLVTKDRQKVVDKAIHMHEQGVIITLMYHQVKPYHHDSLGFFKSVKGQVSDSAWQAIITPGTEYHRRWLGKIDTVASYLKQLEQANVPVLWRPYHEMNGIWFWYGHRPGPEGIQKLWRMMFERYVHHHQLKNLIWVWNANAPRDWPNDQAYAYEDYFPGLEYVDVLATDIYKRDYKQSHHDELLALAQGKPIALGEIGGAPEAKRWETQTEWVWFMMWAHFPWLANEPSDLQQLYQVPRVLSRKEWRAIKQENL